MGVFKNFINKVSSANNKAHSIEAEKIKSILLNHSISCNKCDGMAVPTLANGSTYKCSNCENQFNNAAHNILNKFKKHYGLSKNENLGIVLSSSLRKSYPIAVEKIKSENS